jgi:hypothetical protein
MRAADCWYDGMVICTFLSAATCFCSVAHSLSVLRTAACAVLITQCVHGLVGHQSSEMAFHLHVT